MDASPIEQPGVTDVNVAKQMGPVKTGVTEYCDCLPGPGKIVMGDVGIFASDSPVSIDAAFLNMIDYKVFNEAYNVDCMLQVQEAKVLGIQGEVKPEIRRIS